MPVGGQSGFLSVLRPVREVGLHIPVPDSFQVALGRTDAAAVAFVGLGDVNSPRVLSNVFVEGEVPLVVKGPANEESEHLSWIVWVIDPAVVIKAIERGGVIASDSAPMADA